MELTTKSRTSLLDKIDRRRITRDRGSPRGSCLVRVMSLLGPNRKSSMRAYVFRFAPESGRRATWSACPFRAIKRLMHRSKIAKLFDHLVSSGEDVRWYGESERLGSFEVDDQLVFCWRLNWKVGWLFAPEDAIDVAGRAPVLIN